MGLSQKTVSFIYMKNIEKRKITLLLIPLIISFLMFLFMFFTLNQKTPQKEKERINIKLDFV